MAGERRAGLLAEARDDVERARREARPRARAAAKASAVRQASSAGFSTQALPIASAAPTERPNDLHRVVPGDDVAGDAVRLAQRQ